jgi:hypothetical protein
MSRIGSAVAPTAFAIMFLTGCSASSELLDQRMKANEVAAIASLRAIKVAQVAYREMCGNGGYATSLTVLGEPPPGSTDGFIDASLSTSAMPQKSGYSFTMQAGDKSAAGPVDCHGKPTATGYYATASPITLGTTGSRSFATNPEGVVWQLVGPAAPREPFGPPAVAVQ